MSHEPVVLVVEDEFLVADNAEDFLQAQGYSVVPAHSAADAFRAVEELGDRISALFVDLHLRGGASGFDLASAARRKSPQLAVLYTSGGRPADYERRRVDGARFVDKPYDLGRVCAILGEILATRETADALEDAGPR